MLRDEVGLKSRSIATYWQSHNPTEDHCFKIAAAQRRLESLSDAESVAAATKWLELAKRYTPGRHTESFLLTKLNSTVSKEDTQSFAKPIIEWLESLGSAKEQWIAWVRTCLQGQAAATIARDAWIDGSVGLRQVWHLHHWDPRTSGTVFDHGDLHDYYELLLKSGINVVVALTYSDGYDPTLDDPRLALLEQEKEQLKTFRTFLETGMPDLATPSASFSFFKAEIDACELVGDIWAFESDSLQFGLYVRSPHGLFNLLHPKFGKDKDDIHLLQCIALPIPIAPDEYQRIFKSRGIESVSGGGFKFATPAKSGVSWAIVEGGAQTKSVEP